MNAAWHDAHPMPSRATLDQRVVWHIAHAKACGCRPMPATVVSELKRRGVAGGAKPKAPVKRLRSRILENASTINELHAAIGDTHKVRDRDAASYAAWQAATAEFHSRYDTLAFPGGYEGALERIESGDQQTIEAAIAFLEARPFFFRSGYMRTALLRRMKRLAPGTPFEARVAAILVEDRARRAARDRD